MTVVRIYKKRQLIHQYAGDLQVFDNKDAKEFAIRWGFNDDCYPYDEIDYSEDQPGNILVSVYCNGE